MIDTHVHLEFPDFADDLDDVLARARAAGVRAMICVGGEPPRNRLIVGLADRIPGLYAALGIHPHWASHNTADQESWLADQFDNPKVCAVGEIGLDYHYDYSPRNAQRDAFARYLDIAGEAGKPVIVHSRESFADTFETLAAHAPLTGVMHCFSYGPGEAEALLGLGLHISFCGQITFRKCDELRAVAAAIPLERLLLETDCPFLAPEPHRGRRNEPALVALVAAKHAELRGLPVAELVAATSANAARLFGIDGTEEPGND
jgi:TatD DNase family protein